jgi:hypothetical protein
MLVVIEAKLDSKCLLDMRSQDEVDKGGTRRSDNSKHTPEADKDRDKDEDKDIDPVICCSRFDRQAIIFKQQRPIQSMPALAKRLSLSVDWGKHI